MKRRSLEDVLGGLNLRRLKRMVDWITILQVIYLLPLIYSDIGAQLVYRWGILADYPRFVLRRPSFLNSVVVFLWIVPMLFGQLVFLPEFLLAAEILGFGLWMTGAKAQGVPVCKRDWLWLPPLWALIVYGLFLQWDWVNAAMHI